MGTFGAGILENDSALDWIGQFKKRMSLKALAKWIQDYNISASDTSTEEVLACCEIIAACRGYAADDLDPEIEQWASTQISKITVILEEAAFTVVKKILHESELKGLWQESGNFESWEHNILDLLGRLSRTKSETKQRKTPLLRVQGGKSGLSSKKFKIGEKLPDLNTEHPEVGLPTRVVLSLAQEFRSEELELFSSWISQKPDISLCLTDEGAKRGFKLDNGLLNYFHHRENLELWISCLKDLSPLADFSQLKKLHLLNSQAKHPFTSLRKVELLQELNLWECSTKCLAEDFQNLSLLQNLTDLAITYIKSGLLINPECPIRTKLEIPELPTLNCNLQTLKLSHISFGNIANLAELHKAKSIDLSGCQIQSPTLDISNLEQLSRFELAGVSGITTLKLPANLKSLQLENIGNYRIELRRPLSKLLSLRLTVEHSVPNFLSSCDCSSLQFLSLSGSSAYSALSSLAAAPELKCLRINSKSDCLTSFHKFPNLQIVTLDHFCGDNSFLEEIAKLRHLRELHLFFDPEAPTPTLDDFKCFKQHPELKHLYVFSLNTEDSFEAEVAEMLQLNQLTYSDCHEHIFLQTLEKKLTE